MIKIILKETSDLAEARKELLDIFCVVYDRGGHVDHEEKIDIIRSKREVELHISTLSRKKRLLKRTYKGIRSALTIFVVGSIIFYLVMLVSKI